MHDETIITNRKCLLLSMLRNMHNFCQTTVIIIIIIDATRANKLTNNAAMYGTHQTLQLMVSCLLVHRIHSFSIPH